MLFAYVAFFSFAYQTLGAGVGALILFGAVQVTMFSAGLRAGEVFRPVAWVGLALALGNGGNFAIFGTAGAFIAAGDLVDWLARTPGSGMGGLLGMGMRAGMGLIGGGGGAATAAAIPAQGPPAGNAGPIVKHLLSDVVPCGIWPTIPKLFVPKAPPPESAVE